MLNHVYCLVWSDAAASYVPVSEKSDGRGKSISGSTPAVKSSNNLPSHIKFLNLCKFSALALALSIICHTAKADTLPTGGNIVAGAGSISQTNTNMTITQSTAKMAANWQTFNIGADNAVKFVQPSSSSVALNQVLGSDVSVIQGNLSANGQVFLVNPNGVLFTPTSQINAGGLVASTLRLSTDDFMDGNFTFVGESSNAIINRGNITVNNAGSIALIAAKITNTGTLTAHMGSVLLGAGANVTLDLGGPVEIQVTQAAIDASIENKGGIKADGGLVYLTAQATQALVTSVISNTGIIEAHTLATGENGQIMLMGGMDNNRIMVAGILDASAPNGGNGGFIETSAAHVRIADDAKVTTFAATGDSGNWLIDPADFNIGDASTDAPANITGIALSNNLVNTDVEIMSFKGTNGGSGNINVNEEVSWSANTLTLTAAKDININSVMTASGTSTLVLNTATSNGGDVAVAGGQVFVGMDANGFTGRVDFAETDGTNARSGTGILTINGAEYNILNTVDQLANMTITGNFALGGNLGTAESTFDFTPIASFANNFNGLGHTITGMNIDGIAAANTGMIRIAGAGSDVRNVGLVGGKIINGGAGTGGLIGSGTTGNVSNSYNTGTVTGVASTGGLVGSLTTGNIVNSFATGAVIGAAGTGGLVGSLTTGSVSNGFATGNVIGAASTGGLIGNITTGPVSNSYATGSVDGDAGTGGLIGTITTGAITRSYAVGNVKGHAGTGGLIGVKTSGDVTESYATGNVDGAAGTGGLIGSVTTAVIKDVYATGNVAGAAGVGGLLGNSTAAVTNAYAAGTVSGAAPGGLFGTTTGVLTDNFWNKANATHSVGVVNSTPAGTTGLTSDQMMKQATFPNGWDFTNIWFIDEGSSFPLLRTFMTALTVTANSFTKTYDGNEFSGNGMTYSVAGATPSGTLSYTGSAQNSVNAGSYTIIPKGLISSQQGYMITYVDGTLTTNPALLTLFASKVYDGTTNLTDKVTIGGLVGTETLSYTDSRVNDKNVTTANKFISNITLTDGTGLVSNYMLPALNAANAAVTITPKELTVSGIAANSKVYDGLMSAALNVSGKTLTGLIAGDTVTVSASGAFSDKNAGDAKTVSLTSTSAGTDAGNYLITGQASTTADITRANLSVGGITASGKVYDGNVDALLDVSGKTLTGLIAGDTVTVSTTGAFSNKNAGDGKTVSLTSASADARNYDITPQASILADITRANL
ncbi:hypothetical protein BAE46_11900, partial [Glaciecola punicea]|uniref:beta strand repeat-containing protein n=1 Tax=Glaciecola punicea TaxID=56804 RepID=UPI000872F283